MKELFEKRANIRARNHVSMSTAQCCLLVRGGASVRIDLWGRLMLCLHYLNQSKGQDSKPGVGNSRAQTWNLCGPSGRHI